MPLSARSCRCPVNRLLTIQGVVNANGEDNDGVDSSLAAQLLPLLPLLLIILSSVWILQDARRFEREHRPVVVIVFGRHIEDPPTWAALSLVLFIFVFPMYLVARRAST